MHRCEEVGAELQSCRRVGEEVQRSRGPEVVESCRGAEVVHTRCSAGGEVKRCRVAELQ